jgi:phage tail sheath protein FI
LSDAVDRGITVTEIAAMGEPIDAAHESTAAFVGRALRGPLNTPVLVHTFGGFRRRFGDVWSRSSLGPAVRQFFEHGGKNLYVVRVANDARGAMICLPASGSALVLRTLEPGSTECVRAAVDYDGIDLDNDALFNLTLQRVDPVSRLVIEQEMYRKLSYLEEADSFVADALLTSSLVRVEKPYPSHRPESTTPGNARHGSAYVDHAQDGTDGHELSDYDLVGSRRGSTGIFALDPVDHFDILYLPPPGKGIDPGPAAVLAAERYCRSRGAMLIIDPRAGIEKPGSMVREVREQGYASPNMVSYFPRMALRKDSDAQPRAIGGAIAGLLCKLDRNYGPWHHLDRHGLGLSREFVPAVPVGEEDALILTREGINVILPGEAGKARVAGSTTMARGSEMQRPLTSLSVRRLCLRIVNSIEQATQWAVFEPLDETLAQRIQSQVFAFLSALVDMGAFVSDRIDVQCDAGLCRRSDGNNHDISILISFQPCGCSKPISLSLHQSVEGFRVASTAFAPVNGDCA